MRPRDFVFAFCAVFFCLASAGSAWQSFKYLPADKKARLKKIAVKAGLHADDEHLVDELGKVTRRRQKRSSCGSYGSGGTGGGAGRGGAGRGDAGRGGIGGGGVSVMETIVVTARRPRPRPVFPIRPPFRPIRRGGGGGGRSQPKPKPQPPKPQPPPEDPDAKKMTYEQFLFDLAELEKAFPNLPPDQMANKLRMLVGRYNNVLWKVMTNVNNPIPGMGKDVAQFDRSQNSATLNQLTQMMDHRFENGAETGVIKIGGETVALGHVITGAAAGYDRQSVFGMDNLFATTISGDLGQSGLANSKDASSPIIGPKGNWQNGKYMLPPGKGGFATHAEIVGDIDGFNIGRRIQQNPNKPFSQHMKDYYSGPANQRWDTFKQNVDKATLTNEVYRFSNLYEYKNDGLLSSVLQSSNADLAVRRANEIDATSRRAVQQFCTTYSSELGAWCR